jgi:hemolysin activation/secretion protein
MKTTPSLVLLALGLSAGWLHAQDYEHLAPKPVTPVAKPGEVVPPAPAPGSGGEGGQELLHLLKGIVFVPAPESVDKGVPTATGITFRDVTVPSEPDFRALVSPYIGQSLTRGKLKALITAIILYYRRHDHPVVDVIVPEQDITGGVVQLVLLEGKLGKVTVQGNRWCSDRAITSGVNFKINATIRAGEMQGDLDWINSNPFHSSDLVFKPGTGLGQTDLVLQTRDRFPARFYAGYEDSGNAQTGLDRYEAGVNWGDAFYLGLNQQLNYQYTTSGDGASLRGHSGSYVIPLPWRDTLTFFGSYTDTRGIVPPLIGLNGRSYQISARYSKPLPALSFFSDRLKYTHSVAVGFDDKYNKNSLEFGNIPVSGTLYTVNQFVFSYNGALTDAYGQTTLDNEAYYSPGDWSANNSDKDFSAVHFGATSNYVYDLLSLQRLAKLPYNWTVILRGTIQWSDSNLAPSEQLGFGGYDTIRGYDEREVNSDEGYIFTTELRTPAISFGEWAGLPAFKDQLQILGFWDYGAANNHTLLPGEVSETPLSSVGFGLRYNINTYATIRLDYGFQLIHTGFDNDHGSRSDLGVILSY